MQLAHLLVLPFGLGASNLWVSQLVYVRDPLLGRPSDTAYAARL